MIIEQFLLTLDTVPLAKIDNLIRAELARRAEYAAKFGLPAKVARPRSARKPVSPEP